MRNRKIALNIVSLIASENTVLNLKRLYHGKEYENRLLDFYKNKIIYSLFIFAAGIFLAIIYMYGKSKNGLITNEGFIERNDYGKGVKTVELNVYREGKIEPDNISIDVDERKYTPEEIEKFSEELKENFEDKILGENQSVNKVTSDLTFSKYISGYPFSIEYKTDNPLIIDNSGCINTEKVKEKDFKGEGILVCITATLSYFEYEEDIFLFVRVYPKEETFEEKYKRVLKTSIDNSNSESSYDQYMELPANIGGINVYFKEKDDKFSIFIFVVGLLLSIVAFFAKDMEIKKMVEKKNNEMLMDYPEVVNKFALYMNAGMPVKVVWEKICSDYICERECNGKVKSIYEEMIISDLLMKEGKSEIYAYEDFSSRVALPKYKMFISILEQVLSKGKREVGNILSKECLDAFSERKMNAKRLSEEAGTKLLIPMFMMLSVVMIMIIFPAFYSFNV